MTIGAILLITVIVAWRTIRGNAATGARRANAPLVQVEVLHRDTLFHKLRFTGDVVPIQQASIFSKVSGNLERIYADMGQVVQVNQLLALIDTTELWQQYQQASATYENARINYERTKELSEQNLVAKQDLDNADAAMKVARANFDGAATRLGYARITAPFSGVVTKRYFDPGANITPNNTTLFTLMDLDAMKIVISVLEKDIPVIAKGKKAVVTVDAFPGREFAGTVTRFSDAVDLSTRTMAVEIDIPNREHLLKPGMFANVTLIVSERPNGLTVPTQSLLLDNRGPYLFFVNQDTARLARVAIGTEENGRTEILKGLGGSESVIVMGQQFVRDGSPVIVQQ